MMNRWSQAWRGVGCWAEPWRGTAAPLEASPVQGVPLRPGFGGYHPRRVPRFGHVMVGRRQPCGEGGGLGPLPCQIPPGSSWGVGGGRGFFVFCFFSNRIQRRRESFWQEEGIGAKPGPGSL